MSAADRLTRLLAIVPWLVGHPGVTIRECAEHFGVTPAQIEQDLYLLVVSGDEVLGAGSLVDIQFWADDLDDDTSEERFDASVTVVQAQGFDRPMRLNPAEAMALLVAVRLLEQLPGGIDRGTIASVVGKLEAAASDPGAAAAADGIAVEVPVTPAVRSAVDEALRTGAELSLRYAAATTGEITTRQVVPYAVVVVDNAAYLDALCRFAGARRTFRLDRVVSAAVVPAASPPVADDESVPSGPTPPTSAALSAVLDLDARSRWVVDTHAGTVLREEADGGARVRIALHDPEWAVRLVLSLGGAAVVVEPPELAHAVAEAARSALAAYPGG